MENTTGISGGREEAIRAIAQYTLTALSAIAARSFPVVACCTFQYLVTAWATSFGIWGEFVDDQGLITVADAAGHLARSTEQVRRYLREGRLKGKRIGGQWFIEEAAILRFQDRKRLEEAEPKKTKISKATDPLHNIRPANELNPLEHVIGIGHGGGSNIAEGKEAYRRAFRWRR